MNDAVTQAYASRASVAQREIELLQLRLTYYQRLSEQNVVATKLVKRLTEDNERLRAALLSFTNEGNWGDSDGYRWMAKWSPIEFVNTVLGRG